MAQILRVSGNFNGKNVAKYWMSQKKFPLLKIHGTEITPQI